MEKVIINGEWNRDNSIRYKAALYTQNPGEFMKKIEDLGSGVTPALHGDTDADVVAYFSTVYPGKQIVSKVD